MIRGENDLIGTTSHAKVQFLTQLFTNSGKE